MRTILITGAATGIGYHAATTLRTRGWRVFASARKEADCDRLRSEGLDSVLIDYEAPDTIAAGLADMLDATDGRIDALFNNGAYAIPGLVEDLPTDALRAIFEANFFGWHDLTRRVIPAMRAQGHGRIVQNSSVLGFAAMPWRGAYNATKFALEGLTDTLRLEMRDEPIHVSLIEPGPITSMFRANARVGFERWIDWKASVRAKDYEAMMPVLYSDEVAKFELGPEAVTAKLIHAIEAPNPRARYYITFPTHLAGVLKRILPTGMLDAILVRN